MTSIILTPGPGQVSHQKRIDVDGRRFRIVTGVVSETGYPSGSVRWMEHNEWIDLVPSDAGAIGAVFTAAAQFAERGQT